jgi:two-component system chemotaxis response regulator CheB
MKYEAIVIGTSAGGLFALSTVIEALPADFCLPIIIVQHRSKDERTLLEEVLQAKSKIKIKQADEKEKIENSIIYFAPADYHLLIEKDRTLSLSCDDRVNYSRPSIDVLFETAAPVYLEKLLAIILTGSNSDGAEGIKMVKAAGGTTIAENPATAQYPVMPKAAIDTGCIQYILSIEKIKDFLLSIDNN